MLAVSEPAALQCLLHIVEPAPVLPVDEPAALQCLLLLSQRLSSAMLLTEPAALQCSLYCC